MDFDTEDKIIAGRVLDIDDSITFHGASVAECEAAFQAAVDSYIAACARLGQAAEKPASGVVNACLSLGYDSEGRNPYLRPGCGIQSEEAR